MKLRFNHNMINGIFLVNRYGRLIVGVYFKKGEMSINWRGLNE